MQQSPCKFDETIPKFIQLYNDHAGEILVFLSFLSHTFKLPDFNMWLFECGCYCAFLDKSFFITNKADSNIFISKKYSVSTL